MTTEGRKIQLETGVDATGARRGFEEVKDAARDMARSVGEAGKQAGQGVDQIGSGAGQSADKVDRATRSLIGSIQRTTAAMEAGGKSGSDYYRLIAQQRGVSVDVLKPYLTQLDQAVAKQKLAQDGLNATAPALEKVGISARQTAAALRGVPAQFTDIAVSLQGGQNPLTVLLQQGGQLKDMFGGIGPAARALGGYVLGLVNPFTIAATAAATYAVALYQGSQESVAFQKSIILTGNFVGQTAGQLSDLSRSIAQAGTTQGKAAEVLAEVAGSGRVAGGALREVSQAAIELERTTGQAISKTVDQFVDLAAKPAEASAKLNQSLHYLSAATFERISSLEEQGRKEEAAALAQGEYARAVQQRSTEIRSSLGALERGWLSVGDFARAAWDKMLNVGRADTLQQQLEAVRQRLAQSGRSGVGGLSTDIDTNPRSSRFGKSELQVAKELEESLVARIALAERAATLEGESRRTDQERIAATQRLAEQKKATRDRAAQRQDEIDQLKRDAKLVGMAQAEYDQRAAAINDRYKDPKVAKPKAYQDDEGTRLLQAARERLAVLKEQEGSTVRLTDAERTLAQFTQRIADLKEKKVLTADQKSVLAMAAQILALDREAAAVSRVTEQKKEQAKLDEKAKKDAEDFARQIEAIQISIESASRGRREQQGRELDAFGLGDRQRREIEAQRAVRNEYERYQRQLTKDASDKGQLGSEQYRQEVESIRRSLDAALDDQQRYFDELRDKQADWTNGASQAYANFLESGRNVSDQTNRLFTNAFDGAADSLARFITTGKGGFRSLFDSIVADFIRTQARMALTGGGGWGGGLFGALGSLLGMGGAAAPAASVLSGMGAIPLNLAANGAAFGRAGLLQSANGNIFDRATLHGYGNGRLGVIGEAGPEAVLPLQRTSAGKLGVAGGAGTTLNVVNNIEAGVQRNEVMSMVNLGMKTAEGRILETLRKARVL